MGAGARFLELEYLFLMVQSFSAAVRGAGLGTNLHVGVFPPKLHTNGQQWG